MTTLYKLYCSRCKKLGKHHIVDVSRVRGVKLTCLNCLSIRPRWTNFSKIEDKAIK